MESKTSLGSGHSFPRSRMHDLEKSSGMRHFCLPIGSRASSHRPASFTSRVPDSTIVVPIKKLQKKNAAVRASIETGHRTVTAKDSAITIVPEGAGNSGQRYSISRTPRHAAGDEDLVLLPYPAQLAPYAGFEHDDDLNDFDGDCLVFFETPGTKTATPVFQVHSDKLQSANIAFLNDLLGAGRRHKFADINTYTLFPRSDRLTSPRRELRRHSFLPLMRNFSPLKFPQFEPSQNGARQQKRMSWNSARSVKQQEPAKPTYSIAEVSDEDEDEEDDFSPANIRFELWFAMPWDMGEEQSKSMQMSIRNLLAMLHKKPVVGADLVQTLTDVQDLLDAFDVTPSDAFLDKDRYTSTTIPDSKIVTSYVEEMRLDDIRYDLRQALAMLSWAESTTARAARSYLEIFVHVVGMMIEDVKDTFEYRQLSQVSKNNIDTACQALQLLVQGAEDSLEDFAFTELWTMTEEKVKESEILSQTWLPHKQACSARKAAEEFRQFIVTYYRKLFGSWPPPVRHGTNHWLNRSVIRRLQIDFGLLYEYLVDKDVTWHNMKAVYRREYEIVNKQKEDFKADEYAPVTDILVSYDDKNDLQHIPHPFPLLPTTDVPSPKRRSMFGSLARSRVTESSARMEIFSRASNLDIERESSDFVTAFQQHESNLSSSGVTAQEARLGRWILLYGILQTLSTLSVDIPALRYVDDVEYFLCFGLNNQPSWSTSPTPSTVLMPSQQDSYCWTLADQWYNEKFSGSAYEDVRPASNHDNVDDNGPSPTDSAIANLAIDTARANKNFILPDGTLIPAPQALLRPSPAHTTFSRPVSHSSVTALPQIPEKSTKRQLSLRYSVDSAASTTSTAVAASLSPRRKAARISITQSLKSEISAAERERNKQKEKRMTVLSTEGTEWADTEFSGEAEEGNATVVSVRSGIKGRLMAVEKAMASRSTVASAGGAV